MARAQPCRCWGDRSAFPSAAPAAVSVAWALDLPLLVALLPALARVGRGGRLGAAVLSPTSMRTSRASAVWCSANVAVGPRQRNHAAVEEMRINISGPPDVGRRRSRSSQTSPSGPGLAPGLFLGRDSKPNPARGGCKTPTWRLAPAMLPQCCPSRPTMLPQCCPSRRWGQRPRVPHARDGVARLDRGRHEIENTFSPRCHHTGVCIGD